MSFAFELTHWFVDYRLSWIVSAPIILPLACVAAFQQLKPRYPTGGNGSRLL